MKDNNGKPLDHIRMEVEQALSRAFGGVTVVNAHGSWVSPKGELISEPVWQLITAYEPSQAGDDTIRHAANHILIHGEQQQVYTRNADGNVHIFQADKPTQLAIARAKAARMWRADKYATEQIIQEGQSILDDIDYEGFNDLGPGWTGNR
jgi:hypothetical protein